MARLDKAINTAKKLINLPYNKFNLNNYLSILKSHKINFTFTQTKENLPIRLMSGNNENSGIVKTGLLEPKNRKNIYIIGKGVLFDSGGMDIKTRGMSDMTGDKAGAIIALSVANYFKNGVVAYCPVTTNFIHTSKIIPGDEIKIGKKIVKVTNTDAEGRLVLAEAITSLNASKDDIIITIATLTGAVAYAIGEKATGVFSTNNELLRKYSEASFESNEYAWGLPLWDYLEKDYYSKKTIVNSTSKIKCGTTEAALFVKQFVPNSNNWIHLDIAYSAFSKEKANGVPIKSLINFIKKLK
jgi:leucyl aminopeptidase